MAKKINLSTAKEMVKIGSDNWEVLLPQRAGGHYEKYRNQNKVIVVRSDGDKYVRVYLSDPLVLAIADGKKSIPEWCEVLLRGHKLGFRAAAIPGKGNGGYKLTNKNSDSTQTYENGLYFINISAWVKRYDIQAGVYDAEIIGNVAAFDFKDKPSQI